LLHRAKIAVAEEATFLEHRYCEFAILVSKRLVTFEKSIFFWLHSFIDMPFDLDYSELLAIQNNFFQ